MVLDVSTADCKPGGSDNCCYNPFERLQPPLRSEEDEIRKGIFGQALRLLYTSTDEKRLQWRHAIMESIAARESGQRKNSNKKMKKKVAVERSDDGGERQKESTEEEKEAKKNYANDGTESAVYAECSEKCGNSTAVAEEQLSDLEFIAAYLRTLLDKVVGLSLLELHVDALRVLCFMLGIQLPNNRSKMTHYSTLANFHYTHCEKLGKRVSSSQYLQTQLKRDEEMLRKIFPKGLTSNAASSLSSNKARAVEKLSSSASAGNKNKRQKKDGTLLLAIDSNVSSLATAPYLGPLKSVAQLTAVKLPNTHTVDASESTATGLPELEVWNNGKVFGHATASCQRSARQLRQPTGNEYDNSCDDEEEEEEEEEEWPLAELEKKVASVVQMYDPVTSAVVVKKLAQMGYRKSCAKETVEAILYSFHQRGLVFYDNGIAYLL